MKPNISLDDATNLASNLSNLVNKYVVSTLTNIGVTDVAGFVFDVPKEHKIEMESDATDHYTEKNVAIQDHIANKPIIISTGGFVGELVYKPNDPVNKLQSLGQKLIIINSFLPVITAGAQSAQNLITQGKPALTQEYLDGVVNNADDLYAAYQRLNPPKTAQAKAFNFFRALRDSKQLVTVQTPWGQFNKMALIGISVTQPEDTRYISDFSIILKEIKQAATSIVPFDPNKYQGRAAEQNAEIIDKGKASGKASNEGLTSTLFKGLTQGLELFN